MRFALNGWRLFNLLGPGAVRFLRGPRFSNLASLLGVCSIMVVRLIV